MADGSAVLVVDGLSQLCLDPSEAVDRLEMDLTELRVVHAQTLLRSQAQNTDLALVNVAMHVAGGLAGLVQRVDPRQRRVNLAFGCLLYTSPSPRDRQKSRMPSSA